MCPGPQPGHTLTSGSGPADRRPACRPTAAALQQGAGLPDPALGCCRYGERATLLLGSQSGSADSVSSRQIAVTGFQRSSWGAARPSGSSQEFSWWRGSWGSAQPRPQNYRPVARVARRVREGHDLTSPSVLLRIVVRGGLCRAAVIQTTNDDGIVRRLFASEHLTCGRKTVKKSAARTGLGGRFRSGPLGKRRGRDSNPRSA